RRGPAAAARPSSGERRGALAVPVSALAAAGVSAVLALTAIAELVAFHRDVTTRTDQTGETYWDALRTIGETPGGVPALSVVGLVLAVVAGVLTLVSGRQRPDVRSEAVTWIAKLLYRLAIPLCVLLIAVHTAIRIHQG
uniref:hypothetical protein n=1 Tax=Streptomyces sp. YIM 98790 TaxID=2689077 RepID=UPI0014072F9E